MQCNLEDVSQKLRNAIFDANLKSELPNFSHLRIFPARTHFLKEFLYKIHEAKMFKGLETFSENINRK